jgi:hypothetical protein
MLILVVLLLSISFSYAQSEVTLEPIQNEITLVESATYKLSITNNAAVEQRYIIYSLQTGVGWSVDPSPLRDKIITLDPGESQTTTIVAKPLEDFPAGIYYVPISIDSDLGEQYNKKMKMYVNSGKALNFVPSIKVDVDMDEKIDPTKTISIKLFLENNNPLDLTDLQVTIQSDMPEFVKDLYINLPPLEKKTVEFTISPNKFQQPKDYVIFFVFIRDGQTVKVVDKKIEIVSLDPSFTTDLTTDTVFLKMFRVLKITNGGNVKNFQQVDLPVSFFEAIFTTGNAKSVSTDSGRVLRWEVELGVNEEITIYYFTNYRIIIYILSVALIFLIFYFAVRSPLFITKRAVTAKHEQGLLSEIKITLEVRNKTSKTRKHIEIIDMVPTIANVEKSLELGTLKPKEIRHTKKGTKVIWALAELEGNEHRLITYKVKAKLNILGTFSLPRAIVTFSKGRKTSKAYSNIFKIKN